jgi:type I restriction enzyme, S subunit
MEVKPGYKQTDVGAIPDDWDVSTVGREFDIKLGKMLDAEKNVGTAKPYLGNKAVQWDRIDINDLPTVPMSRADIERFRLRKGDLLVCEGGEVGRAAIWDAPIEECYYQKALHRLRPVRGFDSRLMAAILKQFSERGRLANYVTQTSIAHLPREKFVEVPLQVPPPPEQRAIAEALSDVDALRGALDRLIAKKRDLKQAAMQQLLTGQSRLPGFQGEWDVAYLGKLLTMKATYGIVTAGHFQSTGVLMLRGGDIKGGLIGSDMPSVSPAKSAEYARTILKRDDVVIALVGYPGEAARVPATLEGANISRAVGLLRPNNKIAPDYLVSYLNSPIGRKIVLAPSAGSAQLVVNLAELNKLQFPLPPLPEQTAIAEVLADMDAELATLKQRRDKIRDLKQAMMQELLTGKTRLV